MSMPQVRAMRASGHRRNASWNDEPMLSLANVDEFVTKFAGDKPVPIKKVCTS
jgi:hypothetical protein